MAGYGELVAESQSSAGPAPAPSVRQPSTAASASSAGAGSLTCDECGRVFRPDEVIALGGKWVCSGCKPMAMQRLREGVATGGELRYAGFWIRFAAKFIDWVIMSVINVVVSVVIQGGLGAALGANRNQEVMIVLMMFVWIVNMTLAATYTTFLVGRFGATLGKMACGVRIVRSDGTKVSYLRALGRHFAEMLNGFTLMIGYIIAAFDAEKRALHDHICDTRVVYK